MMNASSLPCHLVSPEQSWLIDRHYALDQRVPFFFEGVAVVTGYFVASERIGQVIEQAFVAVGAFLLLDGPVGGAQNLRQIVVGEQWPSHGDGIARAVPDHTGDIGGVLKAAGAQELDARVDFGDFAAQVLRIFGVDAFDDLASPEAPQPSEQRPADRVVEDRVIEAGTYPRGEHAAVPAHQVLGRDVAWWIARVRKSRPAGNVKG